MPDNYARRRFDIPDDPDPPDDWCVRIRIPAGVEFAEILSGLLSDLTWSRNHSRDDTKQLASIVARRWSKALNALPMAIVNCEELMLRQNPDNDCQLQQSIDGGVTWTLAFDFSLCNTEPMLPPFPNGTDESGEAAATVITITQITLIQIFIDNEADTDAEIADKMLAWINKFDPNYPDYTVLKQLIEGLRDKTPTERETYLDVCTYDDAYWQLKPCFDGQGIPDIDCLNHALEAQYQENLDYIRYLLARVAWYIRRAAFAIMPGYFTEPINSDWEECVQTEPFEFEGATYVLRGAYNFVATHDQLSINQASVLRPHTVPLNHRLVAIWHDVDMSVTPTGDPAFGWGDDTDPLPEYVDQLTNGAIGGGQYPHIGATREAGYVGAGVYAAAGLAEPTISGTFVFDRLGQTQKELVMRYSSTYLDAPVTFSGVYYLIFLVIP